MQVELHQNKLASLLHKWKRDVILLRGLQALALCLLIAASLYKFTAISPLWALPLFFVWWTFLVFTDQRLKINDVEVARFLSRHFPELEESSHLLLRGKDNLNRLETLQLQKVEEKLAFIHPGSPLGNAVRRAVILLAMSLLLSVLLAGIKMNTGSHSELPANKKNSISSVMAATLQSVDISIQPPAYTGKGKRSQNSFDIDAEEGADLKWTIHTTKPVVSPKLFLSDSTIITFTTAGSDNKTWEANTRLNHPGFYQLAINDEKSAYYRLGMIRDQAPRINIRSPKSYTVIDYGMPLKLPLFLTVSDDYGVGNVTLVTTISSGSGEAVKFKEKETALPANFSAHLVQYDLDKTLDLAGMGMHPGDELYFYAKATDTRKQESRSDIYIVSLPDTAQLLSLEGLVLPVNVNPEFFRSQRQIIIETEQLLRETDTLREETMKTRSNNLGIDQKLLRLRYGKFLGEEDESSQLHEGEDAVTDPGDIGNAQKILDQFTDKHDNAEDATYFDANTKNQLKATLTEMWNAELKLRTFKPREALPYEYKALRLLKDLQQKSRAYVAKTGARTTPLSAEKRLSGDLSKILQPVNEQQNLKSEAYNSEVPQVLAILEKLKGGETASAEDKALLSEALSLLSARAATEPATFMPAMQSMQKILDHVQKKQAVSNTDLSIASDGLFKMNQSPLPQPGDRKKITADELGDQYFKNLKPTHQP